MSAAAAAIRKPVIGVIFYSTYGHVAALAEEVIKGVESTGAIVKPYQIEETLSAEVLQKMHAGGSLKPKYPVINALTKPEELTELDGFLLGAPTRYGRLPAQVSAFFDTTGGLWAKGALSGKFAATFTSTASQHGGQETTHLTTVPFFVHHGIIYVPIGYTNPFLTDLTDIHGGSAYGASTIAAADGSRQPTSGELQTARYQGETFAKIVGQFVAGKQRVAGAIAGGPQTTQNVAQQGQPGQQVQQGQPQTASAVQPSAQQPQAQGGSGYGTAAAAAGVGAAGAGAAGYAATRGQGQQQPQAGQPQVAQQQQQGYPQQGDREQTYTSSSADTPGAYNSSNPLGQSGQPGQQTQQTQQVQQPQQGQQGYAVDGRPDETARTTGAGTGATSAPGTTAAAAGTGVAAGAAGTAAAVGAGREGTKPTTAAQEIPPSATATAGTGATGAAGVKPPQAQEKKKGGLFSCCSTSNID